MAYPYSHTTRASGSILTTTIYNGDHQKHIDNNIPSSIDDYSATEAQMQTSTDPGTVGSPSLATTLAEELERLRFALRRAVRLIVGDATLAQWYSAIVYVVGDILYASTTTALARLAGNTTTTPKYLKQTGDGVNSAAPAWTQIAAADFVAQAANVFMAGPSSGADAVPTFRVLSPSDLPSGRVRVATTTYNLATATGTVAITHGGTTAPKAVALLYARDVGDGTAAYVSLGLTDGTNSGSIGDNRVGVNTWSSESTNVGHIYVNGTTDRVAFGLSALGATTVDLSATKVGAPTGSLRITLLAFF